MLRLTPASSPRGATLLLLPPRGGGARNARWM